MKIKSVILKKILMVAILSATVFFLTLWIISEEQKSILRYESQSEVETNQINH